MKLSWLPNIISILRLLLVIPYSWLFLNHAQRSTLLILAVIIILSDKLDGTIARILKSESKTGALLDSIGDSVFVIITWILFYVEELYGVIGLILLLLPRIFMALEMLWFRLKKHHWNIEHMIGNKIGAIANYIAILWLLLSFPYGLTVLWGMLIINYFGLAISIMQRHRTH